MSEQVLISPDYTEQNRLLHKQQELYGVIGSRWVGEATRICKEHGYTTVLDYGCGKGTFKRAAPDWMTVYEYDPAVEGKETPFPAELVVCTDVLEHIEPEYLDSVLANIRELGERALFVISLSRSNKTLPDGRNAHLIIQPKDWWLDRIKEHFEHIEFLPKRKLDELPLEAW